jgi:MoxR-like ATPase
MKLSVGYPDEAVEIEVLRGANLRSPDALEPVTDTATVGEMVRMAQQVHVAEPLYAYAVRLAAATRTHPHVRVGVSPRGVIALTRAACAYALINGRGYVLPEDLKALLGPVFAHRILLTPDAQLRGTTSDEVLADAMRGVPVPLPGGGAGPAGPAAPNGRSGPSGHVASARVTPAGSAPPATTGYGAPAGSAPPATSGYGTPAQSNGAAHAVAAQGAHGSAPTTMAGHGRGSATTAGHGHGSAPTTTAGHAQGPAPTTTPGHTQGPAPTTTPGRGQRSASTMATAGGEPLARRAPRGGSFLFGGLRPLPGS